MEGAVGEEGSAGIEPATTDEVTDAAASFLDDHDERGHGPSARR